MTEQLSQFTEEYGTTDNPRDDVTTTSEKDARVKSLLKDYDKTPTDQKFLTVSHALAGRDLELGETVKELENVFDDPPDKLTSEQLTELREWQTLLDMLTQYNHKNWDLRKFSDTGETPQEINDKAADSDTVWGLMSMNTKIEKTGDMRIYDLDSIDTYAIVLVTVSERSTQPFAVQIGRREGKINIHFTDDPERFFNKELKPDRWRRPQDLA